ncbi:cache domain-containing sensor histidine kinase [Cohnella fermenti]|nr:sensor histidine kinase [Cohnella fermenti]
MPREKEQGALPSGNLKQKVVFSLAAILSVVFFVSGYIVYLLHVQIARDEVRDQFSQTVEQMMHTIDQRVQGSYKLSNQIIWNERLVSLLTQADRSYYEVQAIQTMLDQVMVSESQLMSINLFNNGGVQFRPANSFLSKPLNESAYLELQERLAPSDGELIWYRTSLADLLTAGSADSEVIVAARWMKNERLENYGVLAFVFHERYFMNELQSMMKNRDGNTYLLDGDGSLLYTDDKAFAGLPELREALAAEEDAYISGEAQSDLTGFRLIARNSYSTLKEKSRYILSVSLIGGVVGIGLSALLVMFAIQSLFKPMSGLVAAMRRVRQGQLETRVKIRTRDELAFLGDSFNHMLEHIDTLIKEVYEKQLREREAELKALQAQLNPHFLYNTLDMIYWRLYLQEDRDNAELIIALSDMLRYSLEPAGKATTVKDELIQINRYLKIQSCRFEDVLEVRQCVDEEVLACRIMPLLLQPIVENAFVHGFRHSAAERCLLTLRMYREQAEDGVDNRPRLVIEISDNGIGMPQERADRLLRSAFDSDRVHLGVHSVIRRIALAYGQPYGLEIDSIEREGTTMRLRLPFELAPQEGTEAEVHGI